MLRFRNLVGVAVLLVFAAACRADISAEAIQRAKEATALLDVDAEDGIDEGTAFCFEASGLFVTNAHVVAGLKPSGTLTLILSPGQKTEAKVTAHTLLVNHEADLAIVQADKPAKFTALAFGDPDVLVETTAVVAFGYPFGTQLAAKKGELPTVSVNTGHITALRKVNGTLVSIQLDASLNPGNSGGPVLNGNGEVIGIVNRGIQGTGVNMAIPVSSLRTILSQLNILFTPPAVDALRLREPADFHFQLFAPLITTTNKEPVEVTLKLVSSAADTREFKATATDATNFVVKAPLLPPAPASPELQIMAQSGKNRRILFAANDCNIKVGGVDTPLGSISRIENGAKAQVVTMNDNRVVRGTVTGLGSVAPLSGKADKVNLGAYETILIARRQAPSDVAYTVEAVRAGKVVARREGLIHVSPPTRLDGFADMWPSEKDNAWTLDTTVTNQATGQVATMAQIVKVVSSKDVDEGRMALLEYTANGKVVNVEAYIYTLGSICRIAVGPTANSTVDPPMPLVKYPLTVGQSWKWKGVVSTDSVDYAGVADLTVPEVRMLDLVRGPTLAYRVHMHITMAITDVPTVSDNDFWFAPGIGLVRQTGTVGDVQVECELTDFKLKK